MITRGTTYVHEVNVPHTLSEIAEGYLTFVQNNQTILEKSFTMDTVKDFYEDIECKLLHQHKLLEFEHKNIEVQVFPHESSIRFLLKPIETLRFTTVYPLEIQFKYKLMDGTVIATNIETKKIQKVLKRDLI